MQIPVRLNYPKWLAGLSVLSGFMTALASALDIDRRKSDHIVAGKGFTVLKHEARSLYETFGHGMEYKELVVAVRRLRDKYNDLANYTPPTTNRAFKKASKRIKKGIHFPDFKNAPALTPKDKAL